MEKVKVLYVLPSLSKVNGISSYAMNYYRNLNKNKIKCDFLVLHKREDYYKSEIENNGDCVFEIGLEDCRNIFEFIIKIKKFMREHKYDIVHCNVINLGIFILYFAKKYNIKVRILHAHATQTGETLLKKIRNDVTLYFAKRFANQYFACSDAAGVAMFKKKKFKVIHNAINEEEFVFNEKYREEIRNELNIKNDEILLGNIGRICEQKNQKFLLNLLKKLLEGQEYKLIMVGTGTQEEKIKSETNKLGLENNIIFLENRSDAYKIYSAIDLLLLPSLYEGLPVVGIEAQCNGVPCIFSDRITNEVKINNNIEFLPIDTNEKWVEVIKKNEYTRNVENHFNISDYSIKKQANKLEKIYYKLRDGDSNEC